MHISIPYSKFSVYLSTPIRNLSTMSVELTDREHQIIQQLILDRWNPHRINKKIADHHRLTINQVKYVSAGRVGF